MMDSSSAKIQEITVFKPDFICALFLAVVYVLSWAGFGLKFLCALLISLLTGLAVKLTVKKSFSWKLFLLFPLFYPLALPLWVIPPLLALSYYAICSAFGGTENQIFDPLIFALVFMICGYGYTSALGPSAPLDFGRGFVSHTAGIPPTQTPWEIYSAVPVNEALKNSFTGALPALPGASRAVLFSAFALTSALCFGSKRVFLLLSMVFIPFFSFIFGKLPADKCYYPLLFGLMPLLLFSEAYDSHESGSESKRSESFSFQVIKAFYFVLFGILFTFGSSNPLSPAFGMLLAELLTPLSSDILNCVLNLFTKKSDKKDAASL